MHEQGRSERRMSTRNSPCPGSAAAVGAGDNTDRVMATGRVGGIGRSERQTLAAYSYLRV